MAEKKRDVSDQQVKAKKLGMVRQSIIDARNAMRPRCAPIDA